MAALRSRQTLATQSLPFDPLHPLRVVDTCGRKRTVREGG